MCKSDAVCKYSLSKCVKKKQNYAATLKHFLHFSLFSRSKIPNETNGKSFKGVLKLNNCYASQEKGARETWSTEQNLGTQSNSGPDASMQFDLE